MEACRKTIIYLLLLFYLYKISFYLRFTIFIFYLYCYGLS